jgi:hypothetical protein
VTSQCSPYAHFRRALDSRNATVAFATATELDFVSLPDALELVLLLVDDPGRFRRAALRWHARYCAKIPDVGFEEAGRARVPRRPRGTVAGRRQPAGSPHSSIDAGSSGASEALIRWAC